MNNHAIIEKLSKTDIYLNICKRYTMHEPYELYNEFLISIFNTDNTKLLKLIDDNRFDSHCRNVIYWNAIRCGNKINYKPKWLKNSNISIDQINLELTSEVENKINKELKFKAIEQVIEQESYWYNQRICELYISGMSIHQIKTKTTIHRRHIEPIIKNFIKEVKNKYQTLCTQ